MRRPGGQDYLLIVEWQGYRDLLVLWRVVSYVALLSQQPHGLPVVGVLVYLTPSCDVGETVRLSFDERVGLEWRVPCVRLWEHDAPAALASGNLGLTILSPLMRHASAELVEQATTRVLQEAPVAQQADLLSILGAFAEPLIEPQRFVRMVGKEQLMSSDLLSYLMAEKEAEFLKKEAELKGVLEAERARYEADQAELLAREKERTLSHLLELQQILADTVVTRFPQAPLALVNDIHRVRNPVQLRVLISAALRAPELGEFERQLHQAAEAT
ncbi:MAG: hypothetical protein HC884_07000 [Chloroflexaceae bacterium]|nr:hypothetical protein [Chloroflexaceae bacterium]